MIIIKMEYMVPPLPPEEVEVPEEKKIPVGWLALLGIALLFLID